MKTQNQVQLIGYLGSDPIPGTSVTGSRHARLRLATDYFNRKEDGTEIKKIAWHSVMVWDKLAEQVLEDCIKGSHVLVQGEIRYRTYQNKEGITVHTTEIRALRLINLDR